MQQNLATSHEQQQQQPQPTLPSYAEAIRTAAPPNFNYPRTVDRETYHPSAPVYATSIQSVPVHSQYVNQSNYTQMPFPATVCAYPPTYTTNAYNPYGQAAEDCAGGPTTIHIIRPVSTQSSACCSGTRSRVLAVVLGLIILGAILRVTMNASF